jgi:septal ring factor EnvC (AmiA/AmiB activator)
MPSLTADTTSPTESSAPPTKKDRQATARKVASIEAKIASTDKLVEKRRAQLASASARRAALTAKLARLSAAGEAPGPDAYCLKERRQVSMVGAHAVTLANGRPATAGTCPSCGSRLVRIGTA